MVDEENIGHELGLGHDDNKSGLVDLGNLFVRELMMIVTRLEGELIYLAVNIPGVIPASFGWIFLAGA